MNQKHPSRDGLTKFAPNPHSLLLGVVVSDTKLCDALVGASKSLDAYQKRINSVSADIKAVEQFLKSKSLGVNFEFRCQEYSGRDDFRDVSLRWGYDESSGSYRLLCSMPYDNGYGQELQIRPLAELPLETRLALYKLLPNFVQSLSKFLDDENFGLSLGDDNFSSVSPPVPAFSDSASSEDEIPF